MKRYNPKDIEPKWQKYWDVNQTYEADLDSNKPKFIAFGSVTPSDCGVPFVVPSGYVAGTLGYVAGTPYGL